MTVAIAKTEAGWKVLLALAVLMALGAIATDMYLPAMPLMAITMKADAGQLELTISAYLVGFGLGQLIWGPVSDRVGRRLPLAIGTTLFIASTIGCALAVTTRQLIFWRAIQAVGACTGQVLARAVVRDLYSGDRGAQTMSTLISVMAIAPLAAPIVGGQILVIAGWRAIFWCTALTGIAALTAIASLPETLAPDRRNRDPISHAFAEYWALLKSRQFMCFALSSGTFYAGTFAYIAASPFAYISYYHVPPTLFGFLFSAAVLGIMLMNIVNSRLVMHLGAIRNFRLGTSAVAIAGPVVALAAYTGWGGLAGLVVPLLFYLTVSGLIVANATTSGLAAYPEKAGAASALFGAINAALGMLGSALVGWFADGTPWPMGLIVALAGLGCFIWGRIATYRMR